MKKMVLRIAVAALLVPSASAVAMQERLRSAGSAARARMQQMRESVAKNTKCLSEWTGSLMADVGRAIKKRDFDKIPEIIKRHKKKAAGIIGTAAVLAGIALLVRALRIDIPDFTRKTMFPEKMQRQAANARVGAAAGQRVLAESGQRRSGAGAGIVPGSGFQRMIPPMPVPSLPQEPLEDPFSG